MNSILAIVFLFGVSVCRSYEARKHYLYDNEVTDISSSEDSPVSASTLVETHPLNATHVELQTRSLSGIYQNNERLVHVITSVLKNLPFGIANAAQRKKFTLLSSFFLHFFNAEKGSFESDVKHALKKIFHLSLKPAFALVAPIWSMLGKFMSAVNNRIGHIQDLCRDYQYCAHTLSERDSAEGSKCPSYHHHAYVHNLALNKVKSAEKLLQLLLKAGRQKETATTHTMPKSEDLKKIMEECKHVFRVLKSHRYSCFNIHAVTDYVPKNVPFAAASR